MLKREYIGTSLELVGADYALPVSSLFRRLFVRSMLPTRDCMRVNGDVHHGDLRTACRVERYIEGIGRNLLCENVGWWVGQKTPQKG
jgi:hypothetical protein